MTPEIAVVPLYATERLPVDRTAIIVMAAPAPLRHDHPCGGLTTFSNTETIHRRPTWEADTSSRTFKQLFIFEQTAVPQVTASEAKTGVQLNTTHTTPKTAATRITG